MQPTMTLDEIKALPELPAMVDYILDRFYLFQKTYPDKIFPPRTAQLILFNFTKKWEKRIRGIDFLNYLVDRQVLERTATPKGAVAYRLPIIEDLKLENGSKYHVLILALKTHYEKTNKEFWAELLALKDFKQNNFEVLGAESLRAIERMFSEASNNSKNNEGDDYEK